MCPKIRNAGPHEQHLQRAAKSKLLNARIWTRAPTFVKGWSFTWEAALGSRTANARWNYKFSFSVKWEIGWRYRLDCCRQYIRTRSRTEAAMMAIESLILRTLTQSLIHTIKFNKSGRWRNSVEKNNQVGPVDGWSEARAYARHEA